MDRSRKQSLLDEKAAIEKRLKEINQELIEDDRLHMSNPRLSRRHIEPEPEDMPDSVDQPLRKILMDMLYEVDYMLTNDMIIQLYEARYEKELELSRLDRLSYDELHRKNALNTTIYGLTHPIRLFEDHVVRVKSIWVPSDWPVGERVYLPTTEKLINLHFLDWYITRYHSKSFQYLKSEAISRYVADIVSELELDEAIKAPYDSIQAKKITIQEIESTRKTEEEKFSNLAFRTLSAHQQAKKDFDPILDAKTDMS
jgi:hypothetical protein